MRKRTAIRNGLVAVVLVAGVTAAAVAVNRRDDTKTVVAASPHKTAEVTSGDLTTSDSIDGTLDETDTVTVVHRIAGQTSSQTSGQTSTSQTSGQSPTAPASGLLSSSSATQSISAAIEAVAPTDCAAPVPDSPSSTVPDSPLTVSDSPLTVSDSPSATSAPTSSTAPDASTTTTAPDVPVTSTTDCTSTGSTGSGGSGTRPSGSGAAGGSSTGGTGSSGSTSNARVTEKVTSVTAVGAIIGLGDVLYTVDGTPVVAMSGALPAWRTFASGIADGTDVQQLEQSLVSMGYDPDGTISVDDHLDTATVKAIKRWQEGLGVEQNGEVELGSVVFLRNAGATVTGTSAAVGDEVGDGDTILSLSGTTQQIVITVPDEDQSVVAPGLSVTAGGQDATVTLLRSAEQDGAVTVQAVITPNSPITDVAAGDAIKVQLSVTDATGVLIVPAESIVSRLDGGYALQVSDDGTASGAWHFVTIEVLGISGSKVAVRGDGIASGTVILQPA